VEVARFPIADLVARGREALWPDLAVDEVVAAVGDHLFVFRAGFGGVVQALLLQPP
jgi:hypothetical protein